MPGALPVLVVADRKDLPRLGQRWGVFCMMAPSCKAPRTRLEGVSDM